MASRGRRKRTLLILFLLLVVVLVANACVLYSRRTLVGTVWRHRKPPERVLLPVEGLGRRALVSTWHAPRSGGRLHEGADLFAPKGTPVRAAVGGVIWKVGEGGLGGRTVTILGDGPAFYYAHLDAWAPGLRRGQPVRAGQYLGTVGQTGNARHTPPHLHFGVYPIRLRLLEFWRTRALVAPVDPIPILAAGRWRETPSLASNQPSTMR